ncbi:MAG: type 4a pilus biogenesis protein PilO [Planctomycetota bacterium]|jgi:hypothetical protein|nr:type 4a pilus biogenesis protein PilO [Planctomycetota bacterium]
MNAKKRLQIYGVLFLIALSGGLYYLYTQISQAGDRWPALDAPGSLTDTAARLTRDISALRTEVLQINPAREELAALQVEYELAARVLPTESTPDQLIGAIRTKAQQAGVTPSSLTPTVARQAQAQGGRARSGQRQSAQKFEEWKFSLTLNGSYDQIANFINRMEEFESNDAQRMGAERRFFQVSSVEITAADNGMAALGAAGIQGGHACKLEMQTYRYTGED